MLAIIIANNINVRNNSGVSIYIYLLVGDSFFGRPENFPFSLLPRSLYRFRNITTVVLFNFSRAHISESLKDILCNRIIWSLSVLLN